MVAVSPLRTRQSVTPISNIEIFMSAQRHLPALDGIRGIAILGVLAVHTAGRVIPANLAERIYCAIAGFGSLGVDVFFVLSGFLITGILMNTKNDERYFRNFIVRRALRIFPLYYGVLALVFLVSRIPALAGPVVWKIHLAEPWAWTYLFNFYMGRIGQWTVPFIGHFWSLAIEEQFYLLWPAVVWAVSRRGIAAVGAAFVALGVFTAMYMQMHGYSAVAIYTFTLCRLGNMGLGAVLAAIMTSPAIARQWQWMLLFFSVSFKAAIIGLARVKPEWSQMLDAFRELSYLGIFAALVLFAYGAMPGSFAEKALTQKWLLFFGKYSYGIYVLHHFIAWPMDEYRTLDWLAQFMPHSAAFLIRIVLIVGGGSLLGYASYHLYEKKFLALKDRLAGRSRPAEALTPSMAEGTAQ